MVKPGLAYLDMVSQVKERHPNHPMFIYQVPKNPNVNCSAKRLYKHFLCCRYRVNMQCFVTEQQPVPLTWRQLYSKLCCPCEGLEQMLSYHTSLPDCYKNGLQSEPSAPIFKYISTSMLFFYSAHFNLYNYTAKKTWNEFLWNNESTTIPFIAQNFLKLPSTEQSVGNLDSSWDTLKLSFLIDYSFDLVEICVQAGFGARLPHKYKISARTNE